MRAVDSMDMVRPSDFSNKKYDGVFMLQIQDKRPAVILRSKGCAPLYWCIAYGSVSLFFRSFREVEEFCANHSLKIMNRITPAQR